MLFFTGLPGERSGNSLADVLYGDVNPSGRLPYTIAKKLEDYVAAPSSDDHVSCTYVTIISIIMK